MFLVSDERFGEMYQVFTWQDPRIDGYSGEDVREVTLDYDMDRVNSWPAGTDRPEVCLGRLPADPSHYKVFKYLSELRSSGYEEIKGTLVVCARWSDYIRILRKPPKPAQLGEIGWYDFVDDVDDGFHQIPRSDVAVAPIAKDRDVVAAWVARKHLVADVGIREIWYLPHGAPPNEIRLLELSDRFLSSDSRIEPIDFGLDVGGTQFRLVVADISRDMLDSLKRDPSSLPTGWSLDGSKIWERRAA